MKKLPETDAIFERLAQVNPAADTTATCLRLSVDAKATIPLGLFSRGGTSRMTGRVTADTIVDCVRAAWLQLPPPVSRRSRHCCSISTMAPKIIPAARSLCIA